MVVVSHSEAWSKETSSLPVSLLFLLGSISISFPFAQQLAYTILIDTIKNRLGNQILVSDPPHPGRKMGDGQMVLRMNLNLQAAGMWAQNGLRICQKPVDGAAPKSLGSALSCDS